MLSVRFRFHVSPRRRFAWRIEVAAEQRARRQLLFRPRLEPGNPVVPPAARLFISARQPRRRVFASIIRHPIASFVLRGGIDHAGNMPAGTENKARLAAEQACRSIGGPPRHDVVFDGRQNIGRRQIDGLPPPLKHQPAPDTAEGLVQAAHVGCRFTFFDLLVHTSCTPRPLTI